MRTIRSNDWPSMRRSTCSSNVCRSVTRNANASRRLSESRTPRAETILTMIALDALEKHIAEHDVEYQARAAAVGALTSGERWTLPKMLSLTDFGLSRDDRAEQPQPLTNRLRHRFLNSQLAKKPKSRAAPSASCGCAILGDEDCERQLGTRANAQMH